MTRRLLSLLAACAAASILAGPIRAQSGYRPAASNLAAREWVQDACFGMLGHWVVYSLLADGGWVMNNRKIPIADYEKLPPAFNPIDFDAAQRGSLEYAAGTE